MEETKIVAHNRLELMNKLREKFPDFGEIKDLDRKFIKFEGTKFVYRYIVVFKKIRISPCHNPGCNNIINSFNMAFHKGKAVCQTCYNKLKNLD